MRAISGLNTAAVLLVRRDGLFHHQQDRHAEDREHDTPERVRSFLLTPGSKPEVFTRGIAIPGDAIIIDLESTVKPFSLLKIDR